MVSFYFDEMMPRAPVKQLANKGIETIMAVDVGMFQKSDPEHLAYASEHGCIMVTFDQPFAGNTQKTNDQHAGLICFRSDRNDVGVIVRSLSQFAEEYTPDTTKGQVFWR